MAVRATPSLLCTTWPASPTRPHRWNSPSTLVGRRGAPRPLADQGQPDDPPIDRRPRCGTATTRASCPHGQLFPGSAGGSRVDRGSRSVPLRGRAARRALPSRGHRDRRARPRRCRQSAVGPSRAPCSMTSLPRPIPFVGRISADRGAIDGCSVADAARASARGHMLSSRMTRRLSEAYSRHLLPAGRADRRRSAECRGLTAPCSG